LIEATVLVCVEDCGLTPGTDTSTTQSTILSGLVKCEATSKQWVTAVEDYESKLLYYDGYKTGEGQVTVGS